MIVIVTPLVSYSGMTGFRHVHTDAVAIVPGQDRGTRGSIEIHTASHGTYGYDPNRQRIEVVSS